MKFRPTVLSVSGYDPSGGAGLLADIKAFEQNKVYGLGVITALTWQNESEFEKTEWLSIDKIISQIEILGRKSQFEYIKIGLIENADVLNEISHYLKTKNQKAKIIWDPILKASAGFDFHSLSSVNHWKDSLQHVHLITPNWEEAIWLSGEEDGFEGAKELSENCTVYLKGGHNPLKPGYDYIFPSLRLNTENSFNLRPKSTSLFPKHGSGCVLAATLTAMLARGFSLKKSSLLSKEYVARFLSSNPSLLGYHAF